MEVKEDIRGVLVESITEPVHVNVITIKKGFSRGGHSHPYRETAYIIHGRVTFVENHPEWHERRISLGTGESITLLANTPYYFTAEIDSVLVEVRKSGTAVINAYEPYREVVERYLKNTAGPGGTSFD